MQEAYTYSVRRRADEAARPMNASSSSDDDDPPGASTWEGEEDETSEASGDSNAAGERARRVEAAATKRLSLSERALWDAAVVQLRRLDQATTASAALSCVLRTWDALLGVLGVAHKGIQA